MSVLIRDMEMPTSCADCRLMADGWCYSVGFEQREKISTVKRPTWCPLVPVPEPHGDLIDRDDLYRSIGGNGKCNGCPNDARKCQFYREYCLMDFCERIEDAPTIIPAEPAEEGE